LRGMTGAIAEAIGSNILNLLAFYVGLTLWKKYKNNNGKYLAYASAGLFILNIGVVLLAQLLGNLQ